MNLLRKDSVYINEKVRFYAHILAKAKCNGTDGQMTIDNLIECELIDKWEKEYPQLQPAYEENCKLKQRNKKDYDSNEAEVIKLISPVPGSKILKENGL